MLHGILPPFKYQGIPRPPFHYAGWYPLLVFHNGSCRQFAKLDLHPIVAGRPLCKWGSSVKLCSMLPLSHASVAFRLSLFFILPCRVVSSCCPFHSTPWVVQHGKISHAMQPIPSSNLPFTLAGIMWCLGTLCYCDGSNHCEFHAELVVSLVTALVTIQMNVSSV